MESITTAPTAGEPTGNVATQGGPKKSKEKAGDAPDAPGDGSQTTTTADGGAHGEPETKGGTKGGEDKGSGNEGETGDEETSEGGANASTDSTTEGAQGESTETKGNSTEGDGGAHKGGQSNGSDATGLGSGESSDGFNTRKPTHSLWIGWHRAALFMVAAVMVIGGVVVGKQTGFCRRASPRYAPVRREVAADDADGWNRGWENDDWDEEEGKA